MPVSSFITPEPLSHFGRFGQVGRRLARACRALASALLEPLYRIYESRLLAQVRRHPMPRHVALILDGNRRFGQKSGVLDATQLYALGAGKLDDVLDWCGELAISAVTLWVFSTDNFARPRDEINGILQTVEMKLRSLAQAPQIHRRQVRVQAIGRMDLLPASLQAAIAEAQNATAAYHSLLLTIAVGYGGREEISDAVRALLQRALGQGNSLAEAISQVSPEAIGRHLYLKDAPDVDLIVRTSGKIRLSGFLLWQSAYSEFHFTDVLWPAFRKIDLLRAVRSFQQSKRTFGR